MTTSFPPASRQSSQVRLLTTIMASGSDRLSFAVSVRSFEKTGSFERQRQVSMCRAFGESASKFFRAIP
jgi:hypothetical protein